MSQYEATVIDGKTVWLPKQQESQPVPKQSTARLKPSNAPKRIGKKYGERKNWW